MAPRYPSPPPYYHGTRVDLKTGDLIGPGCMTNYGTGRKANHVYFAAALEAAIWGAELAVGEGPGRIYIVEPTGPWEDDPNLTDKKFPGNPTKSYRSKQPVRVIGEVKEWTGHTPGQLKLMHDNLARLKHPQVQGAKSCLDFGSVCWIECRVGPWADLARKVGASTDPTGVRAGAKPGGRSRILRSVAPLSVKSGQPQHEPFRLSSLEIAAADVRGPVHDGLRCVGGWRPAFDGLRELGRFLDRVGMGMDRDLQAGNEVDGIRNGAADDRRGRVHAGNGV